MQIQNFSRRFKLHREFHSFPSTSRSVLAPPKRQHSQQSSTDRRLCGMTGQAQTHRHFSVTPPRAFRARTPDDDGAHRWNFSKRYFYIQTRHGFLAGPQLLLVCCSVQLPPRAILKCGSVIIPETRDDSSGTRQAPGLLSF